MTGKRQGPTPGVRLRIESIVYSKITEKRQGPTPGVHLRIESIVTVK